MRLAAVRPVEGEGGACELAEQGGEVGGQEGAPVADQVGEHVEGGALPCLPLPPVGVPEGVGCAAAERAVEEAVEGPDDVLPPAPLSLAVLRHVDAEVGRAEEDGHVRRPGGAAQVRAVLGVRLPLVPHQRRVDVSAGVHLQHVGELVHHRPLALCGPGLERQEAVVQLRLGVCGRMTHRLDRRFHPRALVRPARIVWVRVQPGIADVHV
mmetsp:Transcript_36930/g.119503  ORF Transcript_36930/g.119503 Transcript_36930/m.119503 type:complete len:210 (-) Transcript_36930:293-922(-)